MGKLEELQINASIQGILPNSLVSVVSVQWFGSEALELTYKDPAGKVANELLYRHDEPRIEVVAHGRPWSFDGDGHQFRLVSEAQRIRLAHLFDPVLAVHTSVVDPLPHQITAVYEAMLPRQPLRFLLADDPGAGKTIMAGLFIKELIARGDLQRCLVVCPGSLAEQWQDELYRRFHLPFEILTNDKLEAARTGNWFVENNLVIARLDKLSRNEDVQAKLSVPDARWDLVVCDEAHKMSATYFGGEIKYTKRYKLGQLLSTVARHFLLMTATPHNGKDEDFQLFMALLDGDRFEGKFRDGVHAADVSDMMRRMVKENLLKFDATPLFPERIANTVPYKLSDGEARLYKAVTDYVRQEFNRAEALQNDKRAGTVGFALTILQRRLASSPEAIYQSLRRRKERLESRLRELELLQRGGSLSMNGMIDAPALDPEEVEDLEDAPEHEVEEAEEQILDQATAARTITELQAEIGTLKTLEGLALGVRRGGEDRKWRELSNLLAEIFTPLAFAKGVGDDAASVEEGSPRPKASSSQKLVIFTEHRDTLTYLEQRISTLLGRKEAVVCIHGGMGREERMKTQESFRHDPEVKVLLATDAAGEGINLQRAHLMVNYDLPWNPNRIEQRFGRIHRIGQTEVCHLWNLIAEETREGEVYFTLLEKLNEARKALGGQVFDILGKVIFEGRPLRELLVEAIRYGDQPDVRARLTRVVANAFNKAQLQDLLEDHALAHDSMDATRVFRIREEMERAEARRLQPHYIESFFLEAFKGLGGALRQREARRFEVTHVPAPVRNRDRLIGTGEPVLPRYERIVFEKSLISPQGQPLAAFVCPGHPLLDATLDIVIERHRDLLRRGAVLVDDRDQGTEPRMLFYLEHAIQDASTTRSGERRVVSKRMLYVEMDGAGTIRHLHYAPYLDYRPLAAADLDFATIAQRPECAWVGRELEQKAQSYAIAHVVPEHLEEVRSRKLSLITKTEAAVKDRLTKEISYWDHRAEDLKHQEQAGKPNARLNSNEARKRADMLQGRLEKRMEELQLEAKLSPLPPVILGGLLVVPAGLLARIKPSATAAPSQAVDTQVSAARARAVVMDIERSLGFEPTDRELEKLGYDIESRVPGTGKLRFIEVKGRISGADTITVTRNEILYSLNKPEDFVLAIVEFTDDGHRVHYARQPFQREPDFGVTSVNYGFAELLARGDLRHDDRLPAPPHFPESVEMTTPARKKLIEVALPLDAINKASAREKSVRHGHPSTLHLWWARRPLAAARAVIFAQMVDDPSSHPDIFRTEKAQEKERQRLFDIIENLVKWENTTNEQVLEQARAEIWQSWRAACAANVDHPRAKDLFDRHKLPGFHDPFAGGGALPLEAQRLGLESFASDLNPVAVLINKAMIEIPPKFTDRPPVNPEMRTKKSLVPRQWRGAQGLAADVRYYGQWMRDQAEKRIGHLYPKIEVTPAMAQVRPDLKSLVGKEVNVIAWIWTRTVKSPNPAFAKVDVPLASTFMLSTKSEKETYVEPLIEGNDYRFFVKVGRPGNAEVAGNGTKLSSGANFRCLMSNSTIEAKYIRAEAQAGRMGAKLMAIVAEGERGRVYLGPEPWMEDLAQSASPAWKPELRVPTPCHDVDRLPMYGMPTWGDAFTTRQLVALTTFSDLVREVDGQVKHDALAAGLSRDGESLAVGGAGAQAYADAISIYLGIVVDKASDYNSSFCGWIAGGETLRSTFGRQAISMNWDYCETNILGTATGSIESGINQVVRALESMCVTPTRGYAFQSDAQSISISGRVVSTDPPYYDNISYADVSDFFYVWLRNSLKSIVPDLFTTLAVPKAEELVATPYRHGSKKNAEAFFLEGMTRAMRRLAEQAHPDFPVTIYYAFKQAESDGADGTASTGWDTFLDAVIRAGFGISGTWPMRTERGARSIGIGSNALASSIILVCRPRAADAPVATRREFVNTLKAELPTALAHLQHGNIAPVDLAQAAIGPGMAVYTRYANVLDADGRPLSVRDALSLINETLDEALAEQEGDFDSDSRWALAWFEQSGFADGEYGIAETLSKAKNTSVSGLVDAGILISSRGKVRLLKPSELLATWDPGTDPRLSAWEVVHHLIRVLEAGGEAAAAALVTKLGQKAETARELAYRLYTVCERKKRAMEALSYNGLVLSWPEITRLAREGSIAQPAQAQLFEQE